ncbi:MAG: phage holin family protein [Candidatus Krumholzibacteria bacterium]|nr:phage holin family protein [Candidatus Krumholzibacteria bacterium]MDH4336998.1 phage holin family protein [Candidatus Krumholzibacteria bacterium]MDH5270687.1 phage holin family protein [Candidatus Krumholzibacteria bacterium]
MNDRPRTNHPHGILDSFRSLLDTILTILHGRAELLSTELEEEVTRLVRVLLWGIVSVFSVIIGASFLGTMLLVAAPERYRALVAAGLGLVFLVIAAVGFAAIRRILHSKPRPFDATLGELEKDRDAIRSRR